MSPAEASASRGVIEPSVSISRVSGRSSSPARRGSGSIENDTRRTGEKIASTGMTPIVDGALVALGRQVAAALLDGEVEREAAGGVHRRDVEVGVEDLDVGGGLDVAGA